MDRNWVQTIIVIVILILILSMFFFIDEFELKISKDNLNFFNTEEFIINMSNDPQRYLKISMSFEADNKRVLKELKEKKPVIDDIIIMYLSTLTTNLIEQPATKKAIKETLIKKINEKLVNGSVENIYFRNFVWQ